MKTSEFLTQEFQWKRSFKWLNKMSTVPLADGPEDTRMVSLVLIETSPIGLGLRVILFDQVGGGDSTYKDFIFRDYGLPNVYLKTTGTVWKISSPDRGCPNTKTFSKEIEAFLDRLV